LIVSAERVFEFVGGALCLDFANTVGGLRDTGSAREYLSGYGDLVAWSRQAGLLTTGEVEQLLHESDGRPEEAGAVFERAIALREAIYHSCTALVEDAEPPMTDLRTLDAELALAQAHAHLIWVRGGFTWEWVHEEAALDAALWRIARSTGELLTAPAAQALGQCSSATCGWLFVDTTRNHSRRWCDMGGCGNREKVRRHRARQPK
jgi:predicted RNA-binding Zn ribbon-like protein